MTCWHELVLMREETGEPGEEPQSRLETHRSQFTYNIFMGGVIGDHNPSLTPHGVTHPVINPVQQDLTLFKDGAYYFYCAYVLRIFRYSNFLLPMLTNTGIFLRGLKLSGESRS